MTDYIILPIAVVVVIVAILHWFTKGDFDL
jgi:hypothetical protein